jgi:hypothetical protein
LGISNQQQQQPFLLDNISKAIDIKNLFMASTLTMNLTPYIQY